MSPLSEWVQPPEPSRAALQLEWHEVRRRVKRGRQVRVGGALVAALLVLAAGAGVALRPAMLDEGQRVVAVEQDEQRRLADGSRLRLAAGAATTLEVAQESEVVVVLEHGRVTFEVSKRPTRRFIVKARDVEVRVVGTKFVVDHGEQVSVTVLEGIVEVRAGDEVKRLTRGAVWIASPRSLPGGALNGGALNGGALGGALGGGALGGGALGGGALGGGALGGGALGGGALGGALGGDALDATGGGAALGAPLADATGSGGARGDDARAGVARGGDTRGDGLRAVGARGGGTRVGDARAGDARVGDARVGDARVGDARGGDARVDDARLPSPRPSPQGEREVAAPDPASDFAAAMRARSAGHVTEAIRGFQQVCERFPSSAYAPMSAFEWGRLALDSQDDPRQAARAFERTLELATSASLIEDALARLTEAYARYDVGSCRRVQAEYLRRFPGGPHVRGVTKACP